MTLFDMETAPMTCDCDALLRATADEPSPIHRSDCAAMLCSICGQARIAHVFGTDDVLMCPDGRGTE